jgi:crotonobetainyl-CoA:carnitine CoA-transferase CaiB-like acyl-CoA transferase
LPFAGARVIELGDELSEFCGKLLAGAGADVLKIEPPNGGRTRCNGPFFENRAGPGRSLYFAHYNAAKRGLTFDVASADGRALLGTLLATADVVLTGYDPPTLDRLRLHSADFPPAPARIWAAVTPYGLDGPYRDFAHSDLVQLALGGQAMVCGYDPARWEEGSLPEWDTPPIAPQMWHTYHIAGNYAYLAIVAALIERETSRQGQHLEVPAHAALDTCTEVAQPMYLISQQIPRRQTARHASPRLTPPSLNRAADGHHVHGYLMFNRAGEIERIHAFLEGGGVCVDPEVPLAEQIAAYIATRPAEEAFHEAQAAGLPWTTVRAAEQNLDDPHFGERRAFAQVSHPNLGVALTEVAHPWLSDAHEWRTAPRAPLPGEHNAAVLLGELGLRRADFLALAEAGVI